MGEVSSNLMLDLDALFASSFGCMAANQLVHSGGVAVSKKAEIKYHSDQGGAARGGQSLEPPPRPPWIEKFSQVQFLGVFRGV